MSYSDYEISRVGANPVELFFFRIGEAEDAFRAYTNAEAEITFDEVVYRPIPITRDVQKISGAPSEQSGIEVRLPKNNEVSALFTYYPPSFVVRLTIYKGNVPDPATPSSWAVGQNFPVDFVGKVNEGSLDGEVRKLSCSPLGNSLKRPGLRRNYQYSCPHVLYGTRCGASKSDARTVATVSGLVGSRFNFDAGWMKPGVEAGDYIGGTAEWEGEYGREYRGIFASDEVGVTVMGPPRFLSPGDTVDVYLGCPHTVTACAELHGNVVNFGGQPFIPEVNPVGKNVYD